MIEVERLCHDYEGKGVLAVDDVSFRAEPGTIYGFLGPSGAGKSTVQNILTGLLPLQRGSAALLGQAVTSLRPSFFNRVGYSFELPNLFGALTGYENLAYFAGLFAVPTEDPMRLLERVGLAAAAGKRVSTYSKGMKQRLLFLRAILNRPEVLFLDEPESGLDPTTSLVIKDMIREQRDRGATILLTTHNMYAADELCDRVAFMDKGRILAEGRPRELKLRYGERVAAVEYRDGNELRSERIALDGSAGRARLAELASSGRIETMHSMEASLEAIFIRLTGRKLSA
ncbi:MAG TPA: ABC transporter ATP-binding protein [Spirochaetales bacterium]|nr:ABC transporter ATP-binding protein [Spirochaetales bacterium]